MSLFESIIGQLPSYALVCLFLGYLFWGKFFQRKKGLAPQDVDDLLDIIGLGFALLMALLGALGSFAAAPLLFNKEFVLVSLWPILTNIIPAIGILLVLIVCAVKREKKGERQDLHLVGGIISLYISAVFSWIAWLIVSQWWPYPSAVGQVWAGGLSIVIGMGFAVLIVYQRFFSGQSDEQWGTKDWLGITAFCVLFFFIFLAISWGSMTHYDIKLNTPTSFLVSPGYFSGRGTIQAFSLRTEVASLSLPWFTYSLALVKMPLEGYVLDDGVRSRDFTVSVNLTNGSNILLLRDFSVLSSGQEKKISKYGVDSISFDAEDKSLTVKLDRSSKLPLNISQVIVGGQWVENITESQYVYTSGMSCDPFSQTCALKVRIQNNLTAPIEQNWGGIPNFREYGIDNSSLCRFVDSGIRVGDDYEDNIQCESTECYVESPRSSFPASALFTLKNTILDIEYIRIRSANNVAMQVSINCSG